MFPNHDWSFLDSRKRELSDRAKHNEKMKQIYEKLDKEEEITDEDLIAAGLIEKKIEEENEAPEDLLAAPPPATAVSSTSTRSASNEADSTM